jgi:hypothetical protein
LLIDTDAALAAIPSMLPPDAETRQKAFAHIEQVINARGELTTQDKERLQRLAPLFEPGRGPDAAQNVTVLPSARKEIQPIAS